MNKIKANLVDGCIIFTITLSVLLGLELGARLLKGFAGNHFRGENPLIQKQEWGKQYLADEAGLSWGHVPYVEVRENGYASPTINVDPEGRRRVPGNCRKENAFTIWAFGGSTMFGYGAPDESTIPAYLATMLNRAGRCTSLINYGAADWQSTQSLVQLLQSLAHGARPHAVVFYDGINDIQNVLDGSAPGGIQPGIEELLGQALEGSVGIFGRIARVSALVQMLASRVFDRAKKSEYGLQGQLSDIQRDSHATAEIYANNVRVVGAMAREFGFKAFFFLQPHPLISEKKVTPIEESALNRNPGNPEREARILRTFYSEFRGNSYLAGNARFFDVSAIFDHQTVEVFADREHLLPEGNRIVAARIAREILLVASGGDP